MIGSAPELAEQLIIEVSVRSLDRSLALYTALGFTQERRDGGFAVLRWGDRRLFLDEVPDLTPPTGHTRANVRIITDDVDKVWALAHSLGMPVEQSIGNRYYGLRDFTVLDLDGFGLRFASIVSSH